MICSVLLFFFFFSSRRRHTRLQGDWSSDVCSSDLGSFCRTGWAIGLFPGRQKDPRAGLQRLRHGNAERERAGPTRSEERRVGKECRSRREREHERRKRGERGREDEERETIRREEDE